MFEMAPCGVKLFLPDFHFAVSLFHISPLIFVGPTCNKGDELFLPLNLEFHVSVGKEVVDNWISQHKIIKFIDN